ncbi:MAG: hypothetical protein WCI48_10255 [Bacteroidota bacterium]|jgi:hypothetical protein
MRTKLLLLIACLILPFTGLNASEKNDTVSKKEKKEKPALLTPYHWNVIKFNPTPMLIFNDLRNITLSYERLVAKDMSVSIQLGYLLFPRLVDDTIGNIVTITGREKYGINIACDYRYYPFSRNRRPAPDGLYVGTFLSYYGFQFKNNINVLGTTVDQNGSFKGKINIVNLGFMLGYQFIFWKRLSLDMLLFGPSLSCYSGTFEVTGNLDPEQIKNLDQELVDKLLKRFPLLGTLFSSETLTFQGTKTSISLGFRYSMQLGIHF